MKSSVRRLNPAQDFPVRHRVQGERVTPSWSSRAIGATNVGFGVFLIVAHLVLPAAGRLPMGLPWSGRGVEPSLMALLAAVLVSVAGYERWSGRKEWGLVLAARFAPRSRGDPLVYTLLVVCCWLFWKAFPWVVALAAPFYMAFFLLNVTGAI